MKIYSWNVNGIRAVVRKGALQEFMAKHRPDILCLQETKVSNSWLSERREAKSGIDDKSLLRQGVAQATPRSKRFVNGPDFGSQPRKVRGAGLTARQGQAEINFEGYEEYWNSAQKPGYSGTAIFTKIKPIKVIDGFPDNFAKKYNFIDDKTRDAASEGRVLTAEFDKFYLVTVYTINAKDDLSRLELKHKHWDPAFLAYVKQLEAKKPVVFCGDLNVAHTEDDLANPKPNRGKKGFTDEERQGFQNFIDNGFIDTFRLFKQGNGYYTWWSHFANARARNVGWRIDYFLASNQLKAKIKAADIHPKVMGSDHCPISLELGL